MNIFFPIDRKQNRKHNRLFWFWVFLLESCSLWFHSSATHNQSIFKLNLSSINVRSVCLITSTLRGYRIHVEGKQKGLHHSLCGLGQSYLSSPCFPHLIYKMNSDTDVTGLFQGLNTENLYRSKHTLTVSLPTLLF